MAEDTSSSCRPIVVASCVQQQTRSDPSFAVTRTRIASCLPLAAINSIPTIPSVINILRLTSRCWIEQVVVDLEGNFGPTSAAALLYLTAGLAVCGAFYRNRKRQSPRALHTQSRRKKNRRSRLPCYCGPYGLRSRVFPQKSLVRWIRRYIMSTSLPSPVRRSQGSVSSDEGSHPLSPRHGGGGGDPLPPPILMYHESARSIVFRDHLRRAAKHHDEKGKDEKGKDDNDNTDAVRTLRKYSSNISNATEELLAPPEALVKDGDDRNVDETVQIAGFTPRIQPLQPLDLGPEDEFSLLEASDGNDQTGWSLAEKDVFQRLTEQRACTKTLKNSDWTPFLQRFHTPHVAHSHTPQLHGDRGPEGDGGGETPSEYPFTSFVTSTSMLPPGGKKMRCYGSVGQYTVGVIFGLPTAFSNGASEEEACEATETWSWPAGYAAKTEFNIDGRGKLINGRKEALRSLATLREYNEEYLTKEEYMVANRKVSGLNQIPYNEVFLRVGGLGRIIDGYDAASGLPRTDGVNGRSLDRGVGLPIGLFVRKATYGHLITLLRTRSRLSHALGEENVKGIPLLLITPEEGVRVLTESLQRELWKLASRNLNPFQNSDLAYRTTVDNTEEASFQQKVDELLDLDETISETLTPEELARIAGGLGATDESVASFLRKVMIHDNEVNKELQNEETKSSEESHRLQDVVNEGLTAAVRAGDYHTSRQLLILYSLVASRAEEILEDEDSVVSQSDTSDGEHKTDFKIRGRKSSMGRDADELIQGMHLVKSQGTRELSTNLVTPPPPPPPPLDTDRLRSATNSDGLLAVLGAAQILKAMQDGSAQRRTEESIASVEEWVDCGEHSMAFRISSWYDQRAAQGDLQIATEQDSNFMAFVSTKAISNRRNFAKTLRGAVKATSFTDGRFLSVISAMIAGMNKPCLRLELLQYVLGLDNRYSIAHIARSVELAATCLGISTPR